MSMCPQCHEQVELVIVKDGFDRIVMESCRPCLIDNVARALGKLTPVEINAMVQAMGYSGISL